VKVISFVGPSDGKTTLVTHLAAELARSGMTVAMVDTCGRSKDLYDWGRRMLRQPSRLFVIPLYGFGPSELARALEDVKADTVLVDSESSERRGIIAAAYVANTVLVPFAGGDKARCLLTTRFCPVFEYLNGLRGYPVDARILPTAVPLTPYGGYGPFKKDFGSLPLPTTTVQVRQHPVFSRPRDLSGYSFFLHLGAMNHLRALRSLGEELGLTGSRRDP
jgi:hypothetical protein